jgi:hypothetical protein
MDFWGMMRPPSFSPEVLADVDACRRDKASLAYLGHLSRSYHQSRTPNLTSHQLSTAFASSFLPFL